MTYLLLNKRYRCLSIALNLNYVATQNLFTTSLNNNSSNKIKKKETQKKSWQKKKSNKDPAKLWTQETFMFILWLNPLPRLKGSLHIGRSCASNIVLQLYLVGGAASLVRHWSLICMPVYSSPFTVVSLQIVSRRQYFVTNNVVVVLGR